MSMDRGGGVVSYKDEVDEGFLWQIQVYTAECQWGGVGAVCGYLQQSTRTLYSVANFMGEKVAETNTGMTCKLFYQLPY